MGAAQAGRSRLAAREGERGGISGILYVELVLALMARLLKSLLVITMVVSGSMGEVFAHGDDFHLAIFCCFG